MRIQFQRALSGLTIGAVLLAACAESPPPQAPTSATIPSAAPGGAAPTVPAATPAPASTSAPDEEQIKAGIQQTLDRYAQAYNENNPDLLQQVVDQSNAPFRRLVRWAFDFYRPSGAGQNRHTFKVTAIKHRELGFIQAQVEREDGLVADWLFRQVDGTWLLSEPTEEQIGPRETIETEHFTFYVYPWAADINPTVIQLMENARSTVLARLGRVPEQKANVYIRPIFGIGSPENPFTVAYYRSGRDMAADRMVIFAPYSFSFGFYDPAIGWEPELQSVLTHEYTHLVTNRAFTPIARMSDWMSEGIAEYIADNPRTAAVRAAVRAGHIIPIVDRSDRIAKQDLEHLTILEKDSDRALAYGFAYSLVAYIAEQYGGLDGWWKFVRAYDQAQNLDKALRDAFGISYEQFDSGWRAWLQEHYR
jgi:hypothetical protein